MEQPKINNPINLEIIKTEVLQKLDKYHIPYQSWGTGSSKTLDHLIKEVAKGETILEESEQGELIRKVGVLWLNIYHKAKAKDGTIYHLKEEKQIFKDGRERRRSNRGSVAEKLQAGELPDEPSVYRALKEELDINVVASLENKGEEVVVSDSPSYPGLKMQITNHDFIVKIDEIEFKPEGYIEHQEDKDTYFVWEKVEKE